jgi:hypothetical protein
LQINQDRDPHVFVMQLLHENITVLSQIAWSGFAIGVTEPGFPVDLVGPPNCMRLSAKKAACRAAGSETKEPFVVFSPGKLFSQT